MLEEQNMSPISAGAAAESPAYHPSGTLPVSPDSPITPAAKAALKDRLQVDLSEEAMIRKRALTPKPTLLESARDWLWGKPQSSEQDSGVEAPSK